MGINYAYEAQGVVATSVMDGYTHDYKNMYTGKELQTGEFDPSLSTGLEMYDFHARFYDPQLGRWFAPDPATDRESVWTEQFSNPYLAMGNNPVMYVDPDGEFAILIGMAIGAYIGGVMANDHLNPFRWDDPNTLAGVLGGAAIGAVGGAAFMAKKGAAKTILGKTMSEAAGQKVFGGIVGGTVNAISEYNGKDSFGWGTLGDFSAGFAGGFVGGAGGEDALVSAFNAGGAANTLNRGIQDGFTGPMEALQSWVGGGLSSVVGANYAGAYAKGGLLKSTTKFGKYGNKFINYGSQSLAYDFAYTDWEEYQKRNIGQIVQMFAYGGITGTLTSWGMGEGVWQADVNNTGSIAMSRLEVTIGRGIVGATTSMMGVNAGALSKGNGPFYAGGYQKQKAGISSFKFFLDMMKY